MGFREARNIHTFLKTAYVHFRLPSLVERAHIPRESISARLPASPLRPCLPQSLIDHLSFSCSLFPPLHRFTPSPPPFLPPFLPPSPSPPPPPGPSHSYFLAGAAPSSVPCAQCTTPPCTEWSGVQRGEKRNGAVRPSASDECDFEKGRAEYGRPLSSFGTSAPLSTTHSLSPAPPLAPPLPSSPLSTSTTSTYQPLLRFSTSAATSLPSRHTTTKHSI